MAPVRLLQLTDLHLYGAADGALRGVVTLPALGAALEHAESRHAPWDALLLTGDLVQDDPGGYEHVRRLFGDSAVPVLCVPGNHDEIAPMRAALAAPPFQVGGTAELGRWLVVLLDSYLAGSASGRLAGAELARLDAALGAGRDRHALVCLHHHPVPMQSRWLDRVGLENAAEFLAVIDRHPNVRAVLWGHVHQAFEGLRRGVRLLSTPATCAQFKPLADGFAIDDRPPGYRWLELHDDGRIVTGVEWVDDAAAAGFRRPLRASAG